MCVREQQCYPRQLLSFHTCNPPLATPASGVGDASIVLLIGPGLGRTLDRARNRHHLFQAAATRCCVKARAAPEPICLPVWRGVL